MAKMKECGNCIPKVSVKRLTVARYFEYPRAILNDTGPGGEWFGVENTLAANSWEPYSETLGNGPLGIVWKLTYCIEDVKCKKGINKAPWPIRHAPIPRLFRRSLRELGDGSTWTDTISDDGREMTTGAINVPFEIPDTWLNTTTPTSETIAALGMSLYTTAHTYTPDDKICCKTTGRTAAGRERIDCCAKMKEALCDCFSAGKSAQTVGCNPDVYPNGILDDPLEGEPKKCCSRVCGWIGNNEFHSLPTGAHVSPHPPLNMHADSATALTAVNARINDLFKAVMVPQIVMNLATGMSICENMTNDFGIFNPHPETPGLENWAADCICAPRVDNRLPWDPVPAGAGVVCP